MLEEAVELVEVAVGGWKERRGVAGIRATDRAQRHLELVTEALHSSAHRDQIAALELTRQEIRVAEGACRNRSAAISQLDRQVGAPALGRQPVLACAGEYTFHLVTDSKVRDRWRRLDGCHAAIFVRCPDEVGYRETDAGCDLERTPHFAPAGNGLCLPGLERRRRGRLGGRVVHSRQRGFGGC